MVWFLMNFKITHLVHWLFSDDPQIITLWPQLTPDDLDDDNYYICIWNRNNEFKIIFRRFENLRISSRFKLEHLPNLADVCTLNISYLIPSRKYNSVSNISRDIGSVQFVPIKNGDSDVGDIVMMVNNGDWFKIMVAKSLC